MSDIRIFKPGAFKDLSSKSISCGKSIILIKKAWLQIRNHAFLYVAKSVLLYQSFYFPLRNQCFGYFASHQFTFQVERSCLFDIAG